MKWFGAAKARMDIVPNISAEEGETWREAFEASGVSVVQLAASNVNGGLVLRRGGPVLLGQTQAPLAFEWLREQRELAEIRETWSMTMEFAITVFVAIELIPALLSLFHPCRH